MNALDYFLEALRRDPKLKNNSSADKLFEDLVMLGDKRLAQLNEIDFFSKFSEGESKQKRQASVYFIKGLGYYGKGLTKQAGELFQKAIRLDAGHIWAKELYEVMRYSIIILPLIISGPLNSIKYIPFASPSF